MSVPRSTAHARETTGTYGEPSVRISGASRAPRYAPTAKPASENAPRRNPVEIPYSPAIRDDDDDDPVRGGHVE